MTPSATDLTAGALPPCPFCGEFLSEHCTDYWVHPKNSCLFSEWEFDGVNEDGEDCMGDWKTRAALPDHTAELLEALEEVSEWIGGWSPNFTYDDEWPKTATKIKSAIAQARARKGEGS